MINGLDKNELEELKTIGYALKMTKESDMKVSLFPSVEYDVDNAYEKLNDSVIPKEFSKNKWDNYVGDKISEGLIPPILYDLPSKWKEETPVIKNNADFTDFKKKFKKKSDYNIVLSNSRISQFIQENYVPITIADEGSAKGKQIWVLKMQIKLWESTFENLDCTTYSEKIKVRFSRKEILSNKVVEYQKDGTITGTWWSKDLIKKGFGIAVDYFNELKIKGIDDPSLNTIQALKMDNGKGIDDPLPITIPQALNVDNGKGSTTSQKKNYEYGVLEILPMNWLQENIQNTLFNFEPDKISTLFIFNGLKPGVV